MLISMQPQTQVQSPTLTVHASRLRTAIFLPIALWAMLAGAITVLGDANLLQRILSAVFVIVFGWGFLSSYDKIFSRKPILVIGTAGVFDNSTFAPAGQIGWNEITALKLRGGWLRVYPSTPAVVARQVLLTRLTMRFQARVLGTPIPIFLALVSRKDRALLVDYLRDRHQRLQPK